MFQDSYQGRKILVSGHTGFKGSWLASWLNSLGAQVSGIALDPNSMPNHWDELEFELEHDLRFDIAEAALIEDAIATIQPDLVFHLAAQPLVRRSYKDPLETWRSNVQGTANVLDSCRRVTGLHGLVLITTDKVYENQEWPWGYRELDALGGHDPYSASKAACELLIASFRKSFYNDPDSPMIISARAGNVIGGGDWSVDRLIPDLVRAVESGNPVFIRSPKATRPWQHVLDCLAGYLLLGAKVLQGDRSIIGPWNFGPDIEGNQTVESVLRTMTEHWPELKWELDSNPQPHEANLLYLDTAKARQQLAWRPVWNFETSVEKTAQWYRQFSLSGKTITKQQIDQFQNDASVKGESWAT